MPREQITICGHPPGSAYQNIYCDCIRFIH